MSEKFTNNQTRRIKELERQAWNSAIAEAVKVIQSDGRPYYQDSVDSVAALYRSK